MRISVLTLMALLLLAVQPVARADDNSRERAVRRTELAAAYFGRGQYGVALDEIKTALLADDDYAPAYNMRGLIYMELKELELADESFKKSLRIDDVNADANQNYGWFLCQAKNKYAESIKYFLAALKDPLYATPDKSFVSAGLCVEKNNDRALAKTYFERALKLRPDNAAALYTLAGYAYKEKDYNQARALLAELNKTVIPAAEVFWLNLLVERSLGNASAEALYESKLRTYFASSPEAQKLNRGQYE